MPVRWKINWPLLIALLAILARVLPTPRTIDDAFITFRYARNLLSGSGFVFNVGQRVLGTTTPLYTLLLAGLAGVLRYGNYPWLALLVNTLADAGTCLLLIPFGQTLTGQRRVGLAAALLWAIAPMSVTFAIGGMETSIFILLLVATGYLYLLGRTRLAALTAGLLLLARPDGALLVAPLAIDLAAQSWRARHFPAPEVAILMATVLPWTVFATLYFSSPIPHSIAAKSLAYRLPPNAALVRLVQAYGTPFFEQDLLGRFWPLVGFILYLTLTLVGALTCLRFNRRAWPIVLFPWLYFIAYSVANPLIFRWYLAPPLPFYFLLILASLDRLLQELMAAARNWRWGLPFSPLAAPVSIFFLLSLYAWTPRPDHGPTEPAPQMAFHQLELYYAAIGRSLAPQVTHDTVLAAGDVGALGYYSNARIIDTVGIVSPEASAYYPLDPALYVINYAIPPKLILDTLPDYVILMEVYGRAGLLLDARFQASYALVQHIDTDLYGSRGLLVYKRRGP